MSASGQHRDSPELAKAMGRVARELLGDPNEALSTKEKLRFGTRGSLAVDVKNGVYHDHEAGAGGGVVDLVMQKRGTGKDGAVQWLRDRGHLPSANGMNIVARYPYADAEGQLLFEVVRLDPKDFRQRRPDPSAKDGWAWNMNGVQRVVYRLPELLAAIGMGEPVFLTEGEKGADAVAQLGLASTCSPGGANKWRGEYAQWFNGADVVILPDNDEPGREHAKSVARSLSGHARRIRVLELPELAHKADVFDWLQAGGTAEQLENLAKACPDFDPGAEPTPEGAQPGRAFGRLRVLSVDDALNAPPRDYLLEGLIAPGELSVWWGKPKCGKSFLLLRVAYGLAQARGMWGREAVRVSVLYVAAEGESGIKGRIRALHDAMGPAPDFHFIAQRADLFDPNADLSSLIHAATTLEVGLVVLDTLARVMGAGDENKTPDMNAFVGNCDRIREEAKAHVAVVHHGGWDGSHARGSIALVGAADLVVKVDGEQCGPRSATVEYAKDDDSGHVLGFVLERVELPPDAKDRPRSTCLAVETDAPAPTGNGKPAINEEAVTLLREIQHLVNIGRSRMAVHEPDVSEAPTVQKDTLVAALAASGWLQIPGRVSSAGQQWKSESFQSGQATETSPETVPKCEHTRLWKRLNHLKAKGFIGFDRAEVWLLRPGRTR